MSPATTERAVRQSVPGPRGGGESDWGADARIERHVTDRRTRLWPIRRDRDAAACEALVLRIARTKVRWADVDSRP